jgi:hypothetical protein
MSTQHNGDVQPVFLSAEVAVDVAPQREHAVVYFRPIDAETGAPLGPYQHVGYTDADGLTYDPDSETDPPFDCGGFLTGGGATIPFRLTPGERVIPARVFLDEHRLLEPPRPATSGDILDRIDDAIEERCACGCGQPLHRDGPSGFFASQQCQARWHAGQATDPDDVYERDDAAAVYVGYDGASVPLLGVEEETPDTLGPADDNVYETAFRLECPHCSQTVTYQPHFDDDDDCDRPSDECRVYISRQTCPRCTVILPGQRYVAAVHEHGPILLFELSDGTTRTSRRMPARRLQRAPDRQHLIDLTWEIMRRDLDRFTRSWLGDPAHGTGPA